eukprot:scaffold63297_cov22-Prasinocladus_malaysianus.AAC.1
MDMLAPVRITWQYVYRRIGIHTFEPFVAVYILSSELRSVYRLSPYVGHRFIYYASKRPDFYGAKL